MKMRRLLPLGLLITLCFAPGCASGTPALDGETVEPQYLASPIVDADEEPGDKPHLDNIGLVVTTDEGFEILQITVDGLETAQAFSTTGRVISGTWVEGEGLFILTQRSQRFAQGEQRPEVVDGELFTQNCSDGLCRAKIFQLYGVDGEELILIPLPDDPHWDVPGQDDVQGYRVISGGDLQSTEDGELWLYRCRREAYHECLAGTSVRILPSLQVQPGSVSWQRSPEGPGIHPTHRSRQSSSPPEVEVTVSDTTVNCRDTQGGASQFTFDPQWHGIGMSIFEPVERTFRHLDPIIWLSQDPPVYVVEWTSEGGDLVPTYYSLFTACADEPHFDAPIRDFLFGPEETFAVVAEGRWRVYRAGSPVGEFELGRHILDLFPVD